MDIRRVRAMSVEGVYNMLSMFGFDFKQKIIAIVHIPASATIPGSDQYGFKRALLNVVARWIEIDWNPPLYEPTKQDKIHYIAVKARIGELEPRRGHALRAPIENDAKIRYKLNDNTANLMATEIIHAFEIAEASFNNPDLEEGRCNCYLRFNYNTEISYMDLWIILGGGASTKSVQQRFVDIPKDTFEIITDHFDQSLWNCAGFDKRTFLTPRNKA
jgi:hypothetical protein